MNVARSNKHPAAWKEWGPNADMPASYSQANGTSVMTLFN